MRLEDVTQEWLDEANHMIERLRFIRDAFLEGRDAEAVRAIMEEGDRGENNLVHFSDIIPMGGTAMITKRVQIPFAGKAVMCRQRSFRIHEIRVGTRIVFPCIQAIPSELLAPIAIPQNEAYAVGIPLTLPPCMPGEDLHVMVENVGSDSGMFDMVMLGTCARFHL